MYDPYTVAIFIIIFIIIFSFIVIGLYYITNNNNVVTEEYPIIYDINPKYGLPGTILTLNGENFNPNLQIVVFNNLQPINLDFHYINSKKISFLTPQNMFGAIKVKLIGSNEVEYYSIDPSSQQYAADIEYIKNNN